jgi:hypothetical protein
MNILNHIFDDLFVLIYSISDNGRDRCGGERSKVAARCCAEDYASIVKLDGPSQVSFWGFCFCF